MATQYYKYNPLTLTLTKEPRYIVLIDRTTIVNPTAEQYADLRNAYEDGDDAPKPTPTEGKVVAFAGYALGEDYKWHRQWTLVDAPTPPPRSWTPLAIKRACGENWATLKAALTEADLYEDFVMAQELREDDAAFQRGYAWAVAQYGQSAVEALHNSVVAWATTQRDKALLPTTKAIYQAIIDKLEGK